MGNPIFEAYGERCRWVENTEDVGLRDVGATHDVLEWGQRGHTGFYIDGDEHGPISGDTICGYVWQVSGRDGEPRYVYGYRDPWNPGAALIVDAIETDKEQAARYADRFAMRAAEDMREDDERSRLEMERDDAAETITALFAEARAILTECRAARDSGLDRFATLKATVTARLARIRSEIHKLRRRGRELADMLA